MEARVRVLDAGTGAAAAVGRGAAVTAVDARPDMVALTTREVPAADVRIGVLPQLAFEDETFDAVVGNFALNHVGRPLAALTELGRITRPGGKNALTIWSTPAGAGAGLFGRAVQAAGAVRPKHLPPLSSEEDFVRDEPGFTALMATAGFRDIECQSLAWDPRASPEEWWSGPASGVAYFGQVLENSTPRTVQEIKEHFDRFSAEFIGLDGRLVLPHRALLASANV